MKKLKEDFIQIRFALIPIIVYMVLMQVFFGTLCPFKALFKIDCPGCGLTHAIIYLLTGNIKMSLYYNWTGIFWFIAIILFIIDRYIVNIKIKPFPYLFIIVSLLTLLRYFLIII